MSHLWVCSECGSQHDDNIEDVLQKILDKLTQITEILERKREEGDF